MRREIQVNDLLAGIGAVVSAFRFLQGALRGIGLRLRLEGAEYQEEQELIFEHVTRLKGGRDRPSHPSWVHWWNSLPNHPSR